MQKELTFLGNKVSVQGVSRMEEKVIAVQDWPVPKNASEVRSVLLPLLHCHVLDCGCTSKSADMQECAI